MKQVIEYLLSTQVTADLIRMPALLLLLLLLLLLFITVSGEDSCSCGVRQPVITTKITGGEDADPHEFPWVAKLLIQDQEGKFSCGGSLINDRYDLLDTINLLNSVCLIFLATNMIDGWGIIHLKS